MALPHQSIATISSPQFINLQPLDINPLMSSCEIKVLYIGENRNRSYISKEVATEMAKTLRGAPIVGYYKENKEDFADHGEQMILDDQGIHFNCLTKPYGFVAPNARVWFQKFNDSDEFGNQVERQYLMTTGYLWTGQFEEVQSVLSEGKPQSMELDEASLEGHWATNIKNDIEFFIINDAIFTKLCILGDDTEPCFEGASITAPMISSTFSKTVDDNFKQTLFSMINELKDALKGGNNMDNVNSTPVVEENFTQDENVENPVVESDLESSEQPTEDFEKKNEIKDDTIDNVKKPKAISEKADNDDEEASDDKDDDDNEDKYSLLEQQHQELVEKYTALNADYEALKAEKDALVEFKQNVENERKDALINEFYMLSDEDKKEIIENKVNYTLEEIKAKLAVICYEKKVNFNSENSDEIENKQTEKNVITYTYNDDSANLPDWVKAVKNTIEENN